MLTNRSARKPLVLWSLASLGAAMFLSAITLSSAQAGGVGAFSCLGSHRSLSCAGGWATGGDPYVRTVPNGLSEDAKTELAARDQRWLERCHPVLMRDPFGVVRYAYAAPKCEYGVGADFAD